MSDDLFYDYSLLFYLQYIQNHIIIYNTMWNHGSYTLKMIQRFFVGVFDYENRKPI